MPAVNFKPRAKKREVLEIEIPDWSEFDHRIADGKPFVLWRVGYQSLLHHWLDHAINSEVGFLRIYCPGKPHLVRQAMEEATLWPIDWELIPSSNSSNRRTVVPVLGLPPEVIADEEGAETTAPKAANAQPPQTMDDEAPLFADEWELLDYWFALERQCFNRLNFEGKTEDLELWIGRFSHVDPSARLHFPLWIGDNVYIGPDTEIGPYASIGHNSVVEGNSKVVHSKIDEDTFLGAHTHLEAAFLDGNRLVSRKHRSVVTMNDAFVATAIRNLNRHQKPGKRERLYAFGYWFALRAKQIVRRLSFWSSRSREAPAYWESRVGKLIDVILGKRRLFGILQRSEQQLSAHDAEWREVLEEETPGVFSYADTLGCHNVEEGMEPIHAVYQATQPRRHMEHLCREYLHELIFDRSPAAEIFEDSNDEADAKLDIEFPKSKS